MSGIPQLNEDDYRVFTLAMDDLIRRSDARAALLVEKAGYLIHQSGDREAFDATQVATLASNAFNATQFMASLLNEEKFSGMFQQGEQASTLILNIDENFLLVVVFNAIQSVGMIRFYADDTIKVLASQILASSRRDPGPGLDLADLNPTDIGQLFRRKADEPAPMVPEPAQEPVPEPAPMAFESGTPLTFPELSPPAPELPIQWNFHDGENPPPAPGNPPA